MKVTYTGPHSRYTVADIAFEKDKAIELASDQVAKLKANGVGAKLFANGHLTADKSSDKPAAKAATKTVVNPDLKPAPKANDKVAKPENKADAKDKS